MRNTRIDPNEDLEEDILDEELNEEFGSEDEEEFDEVVTTIDNSYSMSEMTDSGDGYLEDNFVQLNGVPVF